MAQTIVQISMDEELKQSMEQICRTTGISLSAAFTLFAQKVSKEKRIPYDLSGDPFYSEENQRHLLRGIAALNAGKGVEHELLDIGE